MRYYSVGLLPRSGKPILQSESFQLQFSIAEFSRVLRVREIAYVVPRSPKTHIIQGASKTIYCLIARSTRSKNNSSVAKIGAFGCRVMYG